MPRLSQKWKSDKNRSRSYKLRADRLEIQNTATRSELIESAQIKEDLTKFCDAIGSRIAASKLDAGLKDEINEDLADYLERLRLPAG
jgi:hypothetical protein